MSEDEREYLKKKQQQKVKKGKDGITVSQSKEFEEHFVDIENRDDRNLAIINAYLDGYTQVGIANYLNISTSLVSKVIKSVDITPGVYLNFFRKDESPVFHVYREYRADGSDIEETRLDDFLAVEKYCVPNTHGCV